MALRYWVGGTNTWNGVAGTKWALTPGGVGGLPVPGTGDDVFFDANSGTGATIVTLGANALVLSVNFTGYTGTFTFSANLTFSGTLTLGVNTTYTTPGLPTAFSVITTGALALGLVSNGKILPTNISFQHSAGTLTITGNADFGGNLSTSTSTHTIKSPAVVPVDLRIGGNISVSAMVTNATDYVTIKGYGTSKTFVSSGGLNSNMRVSFVSGSTYTSLASSSAAGTSFLTVESGGQFNAVSTHVFTNTGTVRLSGFNGEVALYVVVAAALLPKNLITQLELCVTIPFV